VRKAPRRLWGFSFLESCVCNGFTVIPRYLNDHYELSGIGWELNDAAPIDKQAGFVGEILKGQTAPFVWAHGAIRCVNQDGK
jgi:hypothetical protein